MATRLLVVLVVAVMLFSGLAYGQTADQPNQGVPAGTVVGPASQDMGSAPETAPPQPGQVQPQSGPLEMRIAGGLDVRLIGQQPQVVYRDRWRTRTRTVTKTIRVATKSEPNPNIRVDKLNLNVYPSTQPSAVTPPRSGGQTLSPPATPVQGGSRVSLINVPFDNLLVVIGGAIAIIAIIYAMIRNMHREEQQTARARETTAQAQATQFGTALANQAPFQPAAGRDVDMSVTVFPGGGGVVRARSNERPQGTVVQPIAPPLAAMVVTAPGQPVNVITFGNAPVALPGQLVALPPVPPAPPVPPVPPAPPAPRLNPNQQPPAAAAA